MATHLPDSQLLALMRERYTYADLCSLVEHLKARGVFSFTPLSSGLLPASPCDAELGRYQYAWMRDNACIARTFVARRLHTEATCIARAVLTYASLHEDRYHFVITHRGDDGNVMNRPHVRWNGETQTELEEPWAHAQHDAHGHMLSLIADLLRHAVLTWDEVRPFVTQTIHLFEALSITTDADSGAWEEERAIRASSLGVALAGLKDIQPFTEAHDATLAATVSQLCDASFTVLNSLLPHETRDRDDDSALLFLIEPCGVITGDDAYALIERLTTSLSGTLGLSRYHGDTFWGPDYLTHSAEERTSLTSAFSFRSAPIRKGREAQWTLFDPIISSFYARQCLAQYDDALYDRATHHLNRSLRSLVNDTGTLHIPELFYYSQNELVPNTIRPLYWAQANLALAVTMLMRVAHTQ